MKYKYRRIKKWEILELRRLRLLSARMQEVLDHYRYQKEAHGQSLNYHKKGTNKHSFYEGKIDTINHIIDYLGAYEKDFENHKYYSLYHHKNKYALDYLEKEN